MYDDEWANDPNNYPDISLIVDGEYDPEALRDALDA